MATRSLPRNALVRPRPRRAALPAGPPRHGWPYWRWAGRVLSWLFFAAVLALLVHYARSLDWDAVLDSIARTPPPALAAAAIFAGASHLLYSCFDLLGRRYTRAEVSTPKVM